MSAKNKKINAHIMRMACETVFAVRQRFSQWRVRRYDINRFKRLMSGRRKFRFPMNHIISCYIIIRIPVSDFKSRLNPRSHWIQVWYYNIIWFVYIDISPIQCIIYYIIITTMKREIFFFIENRGLYYFLSRPWRHNIINIVFNYCCPFKFKNRTFCFRLGFFFLCII